MKRVATPCDLNDSMERGFLTHPVPLWLLAPLALLAGAAAIMHLLVVSVGLGFEYGATTATQATVLGCFMIGTALGVFLVGARSDGSTRPMRWCGLLQIGLALYAVTLPTIREMLDPSLGLLPVALALALMPGLLSGGTVAVLVRAGSNSTDRAAAAVGVVLGCMAIGGAAAIPIVARSGTDAVLYASLFHAVAGLAAVGLSFPIGVRAVIGGSGSAGDRRASWTGDGGFPILVGLIVVGAALPLQRFAWARLLKVPDDALLLHLAGVGGGLLMGALMVFTGTNARRVLARSLLAAAILVFAPLLVVGTLIGDARGLGDAPSVSLAALLVLPGAVGVGLVLPLLVRASFSNREAIGKQAGSLLGFFCAAWGVVLIGVIPGTAIALQPGTLVFAAGALVLAVGTWGAFTRGLREWIPAGAAALFAVVVLLNGGLQVAPSAGAMGAGAIRLGSGGLGSGSGSYRTVALRADEEVSYAVVDEFDHGIRRLYRDGVPDAPPHPYVDAYRLLAHLPVLLHAQPERVLIGSFGSGVVAGAAASHPRVATLHVVDDAETVFELSAEFATVNRDVLGRSGLKKMVGPLRRVLRAHKRDYDVIVLEPRNATVPGGTLWYTAEFYAIAAGALGAEGLFCQLLPADAWTLDDLRRAVSAANQAFPYASLWEFEGGLFLLGGRVLPRLNADEFLARVSRSALDLQSARVSDPSNLLAAYVCEAKKFAGNAEALRDRDRIDSRVATEPGERIEWLEYAAQFTSGTGPAWAATLYDTLPAAADRCARLRALLATGSASSTDFYALAEESRIDLRARAAADQRRYHELIEKSDWAGAARLTTVRNRGEALRQLAASMEDDNRRRFYERLLLRNGGLPDERALASLAGELSGAEERFVRNRLRSVRGEPSEEGEEKLPEVVMPDPTDVLANADEEAVRERLLDAECAGLLGAFDKAVWAWWKTQTDRADAAVLLHNAGWRQSIRAARQVAGKGRPDALVRIAPIFASAYPADRTWDRLCRDRDAEVRAAAAEAARAHGSRAHVATLLKLCQDPSQAVRTGAYHSLRGILGEAVAETEYDPADPSPQSVQRIAALAGYDKQPAAPGK